MTASSSLAVEQEAIDAEELSSALQTMFEDMLVVDDEQGVVSYDEAAAIDLLGAETAGELGGQIAAASNAPTSRCVLTVSQSPEP
ncbi:hypothetical protein I2485_08625 [Nesterenkonia sp. E16_7]|uniref:hypothetical protein n=1 Tax=unclassified Nesterenkonia TaxID=2629769 RepID=UPI001A93799B|nr:MULTISPECIES: hypothetical protein [unclassified Nesterenkonia]MBO0595062.1 hypothetical protein [Nesterenkonia sp. E16_10]MBO0598717.1 hypothetical protein [Nesterenkonia sp. E16_7]